MNSKLTRRKSAQTTRTTIKTKEISISESKGQEATHAAFKQQLLFALRRFSMGVALTLLTTGCSALPTFGLFSPSGSSAIDLAAAPYTLTVTLESAALLNPDSQGRASPVQVRIFLSDGTVRLADYDFETLFGTTGNQNNIQPAKLLTLRPAQTQDVMLTTDRSQKVLLVAAAYRNPYRSVWKVHTTLPPENDTLSAHINVGSTTLTITQANP